MQVIIKKWGNSAAVRIPSSVMEASHLQLDETVDVREEDGRIVIVRMRPHEYQLADLLQDITNENLHAEVHFGAPLGREAL